MSSKQWLGELAILTALIIGGCSGGRPPLNSDPSQTSLAPCPDSPNCVSSQAIDEKHQVQPLNYSGDAAQARQRLLKVLNSMDRVQIVQADEDFIHAEFRSAVFGFIDDVTFRFDPPGFIQVRSAARTGYYDFGVNRKRVETIRNQFAAAVD